MFYKKIIICSPQLGISPQSNLGGEVYDREIIRQYCCQGIKVITLLPKNKSYVSHPNLKVYYLPFSVIWPPYFFNFLIIPWLFWLYRKEKFNILRIHSPYFVGPGAVIFKLFNPQIKLVAIYHHLENKNLLFSWLDRFFIYRWDAIFLESKYTKKEILMKYRLKKKKIFVIPLGVKNHFRKKDKNKNIFKKYHLAGKKVLLYLGGLKERKNISFLLKVISKIKHPDIKLLICGQGNLFKKLIKQSQELKIENKVIFTGFIQEKDKLAYFNLADIFLMPSLKEGFGLSVLEAAAAGVPTVASNISSLKEIVLDGKTGYLVKVNAIKEWKYKIEKLLDDKILRCAMARRAQSFSKNFYWSKTAKKQIEIYNQLI